MFYNRKKNKKTFPPFFSSPIKAGFPSPAEDFIEKNLDLNEHLIKHPAATFFVRVEGRSMENVGIFQDDILIVDRALTPSNGKIIVAILNGEFTVKRILLKKKKLFLIPENSNYEPIEITEEMDFQVWGIVTYAIHACR